LTANDQLLWDRHNLTPPSNRPSAPGWGLRTPVFQKKSIQRTHAGSNHAIFSRNRTFQAVSRDQGSLVASMILGLSESACPELVVGLWWRWNVFM